MMKNASFILSVIAVLGVATVEVIDHVVSKPGPEGQHECVCEGQNAGNQSVFVNLDRILVEYDMAVELGEKFQSKAQGVEKEIIRRRDRIEADFKSFQEKIDKGLISRSVAEAQGSKLQSQQDEFNAYAQQKQNELAEEQQVMVNNIADAIKKFLDKYASEKGYAMVLTTQGGILPAPVAYGDASLDITEDFLKSLNADYSSGR